jgi:hypothetical protein
MKLYIREFYKKLVSRLNFNLSLDSTVLTFTLHKTTNRLFLAYLNMTTFTLKKSSRTTNRENFKSWDIYLSYHGQEALLPGKMKFSVMTSSFSQTPRPCEGYLPPDNSDVTGVSYKSQGSNSGERVRIVLICVQFLTCWDMLGETGLKWHTININRFNILSLTSECMTACFL